jgi:hypothetical protein
VAGSGQQKHKDYQCIGYAGLQHSRAGLYAAGGVGLRLAVVHGEDAELLVVCAELERDLERELERELQHE